MFKKLRRLYRKLFVEGTVGYQLAMYHRHYCAEQDAKREGREFCEVPFEQLER